MKHRRVVFFSVALTCTLGLFAACTIQSLEFAGSSSPESGGGDDASNDALLLTDVPIVDGEAGPTDAPETSMSDGSRVDDASLEAGCCDCDGDHYKNDASCPNDAGQNYLPGIDCDDLSKDINPGAGFNTASTWNSPHMPPFDWNCDSNAEKELTTTFSGCVAITCSGEGWNASVPSCGQSSDYRTCASVVFCGSTLGTVAQACK
jgi:hypothetical protein